MQICENRFRSGSDPDFFFRGGGVMVVVMVVVMVAVLVVVLLVLMMMVHLYMYLQYGEHCVELNKIYSTL